MTIDKDPRVLQVFYRQVAPHAFYFGDGDNAEQEKADAYRKEAWGFPDDGDTTMDGLLLWLRKDGTPICFWSIDLVTCKDDRFVLFGPFDGWEQADVAAKTITKLPTVNGYHIWRPHSFFENYPKLKKHSIVYTDG